MPPGCARPSGPVRPRACCWSPRRAGPRAADRSARRLGPAALAEPSATGIVRLDAWGVGLPFVRGQMAVDEAADLVTQITQGSPADPVDGPDSRRPGEPGRREGPAVRAERDALDKWPDAV